MEHWIFQQHCRWPQFPSRDFFLEGWCRRLSILVDNGLMLWTEAHAVDRSEHCIWMYALGSWYPLLLYKILTHCPQERKGNLAHMWRKKREMEEERRNSGSMPCCSWPDTGIIYLCILQSSPIVYTSHDEDICYLFQTRQSPLTPILGTVRRWLSWNLFLLNAWTQYERFLGVAWISCKLCGWIGHGQLGMGYWFWCGEHSLYTGKQSSCYIFLLQWSSELRSFHSVGIWQSLKLLISDSDISFHDTRIQCITRKTSALPGRGARLKSHSRRKNMICFL